MRHYAFPCADSTHQEKHTVTLLSCVKVPSVWADAAPLRARAPSSGHPAAGRASCVWPVAPVLLVFILVSMAALWATVLLRVRVIVVALVWVQAGVWLVPWVFRLVIAAAVLTVLLVFTVVTKQILLGGRKGKFVQHYKYDTTKWIFLRASSTRDCSPLPTTHLHTPCWYWVFPLPGLPLHHHHPVPSRCRCRYRCLRRCWQIGVSPALSLIRSQSPTLKHKKVDSLSYDPKLSSSVHSRWMLSYENVWERMRTLQFIIVALMLFFITNHSN